MTDIVERLRAASYGSHGLKAEAADEIERLEAKCAQVDRYIALLNAEIADTGALRDEIERLTQDTNTLHADICAENDNLKAEIKRLKAQLARTETALDYEFNNGIALCAEIEQLRAPKEPPPSPDIRGTSFRRG